MGNVDGFQPSRNGLPYANSWPSVPDKKIPTPFGDIGIGDASKGLCGGMVFAVRDLFESKQLPPGNAQNPDPASPAFNFIVDRLFDSFNIPGGVVQYYTWMNLPTHDTWLGPHGLSWRSINDTMPRVRAAIDSGHPCPLGLVRVHSSNPGDLGQNHQVLAWGYEDQGSTTIVRVYDPNSPGNDAMCITFDHTNPAHTTTFQYSDGGPVLGFFTVDYSPKDPAPLFEDGHTPPAGWQDLAEGSTLSGDAILKFRAFPNVDAVRSDAYYATNPADRGTVGWHTIGQATRASAPPDTWQLTWKTHGIADQGNGGWGTVNVVAISSCRGQEVPPRVYRRFNILNHSQGVGFIAPSGHAPDGGDPLAAGNMSIQIFAPGADAVDLSAYLATDPNDVNTVAWSPLGRATQQSDGTFTFNWDTLCLADQGNAGWGTVNLAATPYYDGKATAPEHRFYQRVRIFNYSGFLAPAGSTAESVPTLSGKVRIQVRVGGADRVDISAYYATDPRNINTVGWHQIGQATPNVPADGTFSLSWDTHQVPDQGSAGWGTVNLAATPYFKGKPAAPDHRFYRLVQIKNG